MVDTVYTQRRGSSLPYANAYGIGGTPTAAPAAVNTNPRKLRTYEDLLRERQGLQSNTLAGNIYNVQEPQAVPRYGSEQGPYTGPVPMLPPNVKRITQAPTVAPVIDPKYRAQEQTQEATPQEAPQSSPVPPSQPEVVQQVDSLGNNVRPTDSPSSASLHDSYMSKVRGVLGSDNPQLEWQKQKDNPFWQRNDAYAGLVGVGLSLLSGATPMEAFQNAEGMRKSQMVQDQIDQNMDYLLQKYTPDSVAAAKASGDMSLLKEKGISDEQKYELAALNAQFDADLKAASEGDSWNPIGDGYVVNKRTGEIKRAEGYGSSASTGSDTEAGQLEPFKKDGVWMVPDTNKGVQTGQYRVAKSTEIKALEAPKQAEEEAISAYNQLESSERSLDELMKDPQRKAAQGVFDAITPTVFQDTKDYEIRRDQVAAQNFLAQRELLKGQGAITDFESKRAEQAYTIITDPSSSVEAQDREYKYLKQLMADVRYRLEKKAKEGGFELKPKRDGALSGQSNTTGWSATQVN